MGWIDVIFWVVGTLVVVLGPMLLIHELGHFIVAKLAGVRVEEFGIGYPPRLLKLWRGKGYLEIGTARVSVPAGHRLPPGAEVGSQVDAIVQRRDNGHLVLRRLQILDSTVERPEGESEAEGDELHLRGTLTTLEPGTLYSFNWLPMGAFVKMTGEEDPSDPRSLAVQPKRWRVAVLAAGAVLNIVAALILLIGAYTAGVPEKWQVEVTGIEPGTAAEAAGLLPRDVILAVDGERIEDGLEHLHSIIHAAPEQTIELTVVRDAETLVLEATPERTPDGYGFLGIMMAPWPDRSTLRRYRLPEALAAGFNDATTAILATMQIPARLVQGDITPEEARPASVVGISGILAFTLQQSIEWGLAFPVLQTAGLVSLALGLANLLPLPALDGGRILFVLIEAVQGRRVSPDREAVVHFVGLVILVTLMALVMFQDIIDPIIPWSWLR